MNGEGTNLPREAVPAGTDRLRLSVQNLPPGSRRIIEDYDARAELAARIIGASDSARDLVESAIATFDGAVRDVLDAAGLPRGSHVKRPAVTSVGHGWAGRKAPNCTILIDTETFKDLPAEDRPDSLFKTWVHESIHGRKPYAAGFAAEWQAYRGFEEGMVEGLTRQLVLDGLGMRPVIASYGYYVEAYRALSIALDILIGDIWLELWNLPAGAVGEHFVPLIEAVLGRYERPD